MKAINLEEWVQFMLPGAIAPRSGKRVLGVAIDSRCVRSGDIFFALKGLHVDGHSYLDEAHRRGAIAAVVQEDDRGDYPDGLDIIRVPCTTQALQEAGNCKYNLLQGNVIGVAGSIGKTTVKTFLNQLLQPCYKTFVSPKSYNSQLTVPLSLLLADGDEDMVILEMGVSEPGNMQNLLKIVQPDMAILTRMVEQHTANFSDGLWGVIEEKSQILQASRLQIICKDPLYDTYLRQQKYFGERFTYSLFDELADFSYTGLAQDHVQIRTPDGEIELEMRLPYRPAYENFLAAFAMAWVLDVPLDYIQREALKLELPPMRFEKIHKQGVVFINDAYNACPEGMLAALEHLPIPEMGNRTVLVLGHMDDLGEHSLEHHVFIAHAALERADVVFFIGSKWQYVRALLDCSRAETYFLPSAQDVGQYLSRCLKSGDVVLLKGSRIFALEHVLQETFVH